MSLVHASKIAIYIALIRSIESNRPQNKRLFHDPYARAFLPPALKLVERLSRVSFLNRFAAWYIERGWPGAYTAVAARTRLIDVMLTNTIRDYGFNQVFILGAGFLKDFNMELLYHAGAREYRSQYYGERRTARMKGYEYYRVAMAAIK